MPALPEIAAAAIKAGLRPVAIHPGLKRPIGNGWGLERHTQETFAALLSRHPAAGLGLVLGDVGDGTGVVDFEIDDEAKAAAPLRRIFGDVGPPPTLSFRSNRGVHRLYQYTPRLAWLGVESIAGKASPSYAGLEIRIGATDPNNPKQLQSVIPPTPRSDGTPRVFIGPDGMELPAKVALANWRELVSAFPARLLRDIELFGLGYVEDPENGTGEYWIDAEAVKAAVAGKAVEIAAGWGVKFVKSTPNDSGFVDCFAVDRPETHPSAAVNAETGVYVDHGSGRKFSLFGLAVACGAYPTVKEAINGIGQVLGVAPTRRLSKVAAETVTLGIEAWGDRPAETEAAPVPFPVDAFPPPLQTVVYTVAEALECPPDFVAGSMLGVAGGALGNSVAVEVNEGYILPAHNYIAIVGPPGSRKSPAVRFASAPLYSADIAARRAYNEARRLHDEDPDAFPVPVLTEYVIDDVTKEAVASVLSRNPRGLTLVKDELTGWVLSLNAYRKGTGDDKQFWLSVNSASPVKVNRKGTDVPLVVPRPCVAVVGPLTPESIPCMTTGARDDGWLDRILFVYPAYSPLGEMSRTKVTPETREAWASVVRRLIAVPLNEDGDRPGPHAIPLAPDAFDAYASYVAGLRSEAASGPEWLRGPNSKFEGVLGRIALCLSCLDAAASGGILPPPSIGVGAVERAGLVVDYFRACFRRAYLDMGDGKVSGGREGRQLAAWIREVFAESASDRPDSEIRQASRDMRKGVEPTTTRRTLAVNNRNLSGAEIDRGIEWLERNGILQRIAEDKKAGRPSARYAINPEWARSG